ncbi:GspE/PulE family protein [Vibrio quintilis]|uniref:Type II secretion system protein E n=1 Tax=Vibrio quintilis TaxID=1117707 RepID=A0A1M7YSG2_9VIBR|nr:ATPase, T2SS/T4P/T4SS family [Vibrio quintilis]SHO55561.1 Type II secretion system protein E [Vibrio quintilis]
MNKMMTDERLKQLYYQGTRRTFVAVAENSQCVIYYSEHTPLIGEARDYITNDRNAFGSHFLGQTVRVAKRAQEDIDDYFTALSARSESPVGVLTEDKTKISYKLREILQKAVNMSVSDVHIEIYERQTLVKFRVDGKRKTIQVIPENREGMRIASVIFMSKSEQKESDFKPSKVNNGALQEDLNVKGTQRTTNWRCAWVPSTHGGKITIRWIDKDKKPPDLKTLNWEEAHIELVKEFIHGRPGILMMAGQVGSGKTTSIGSMIEMIDKSYSVHTIEDPPEFQFDEVIQTHTKPHEKVGGDSDEYLDQTYYAKALLRHDPDYEFHGETRTKAAAMQVLRKGETGQKVFTTVHTSGAMGIPVTFIEQFGISPALVSSPGLLRLLIYQALVRKLCPHCAMTLEQFIADSRIPESQKNHANYTIRKLTGDNRISEQQAARVRFRDPDGCPHCDEGERGRLPLVEMIVVDDDDREFFKHCDFLGWKKHLLEKGFKTITDHGIVRIARGEVDLFTTENKIGRLFTIQSQSVYRRIFSDE